MRPRLFAPFPFPCTPRRRGRLATDSYVFSAGNRWRHQRYKPQRYSAFPLFDRGRGGHPKDQPRLLAPCAPESHARPRLPGPASYRVGVRDREHGRFYLLRGLFRRRWWSRSSLCQWSRCWNLWRYRILLLRASAATVVSAVSAAASPVSVAPADQGAALTPFLSHATGSAAVVYVEEAVAASLSSSSAAAR